MKSNAVDEVIESRETTAGHILEDQVIHLSSAKAKKDCPTDLRRVTIIREEELRRYYRLSAMTLNDQLRK